MKPGYFKPGYFITGTDTNVGKTWATVTLMHYAKRQGKTVVGMKPVASGCVLRQGQLQNDDALLIQQATSLPVDYDLINPYAYALPVSPHIAGADNPADLQVVLAGFKRLQTLADVIIVEGAGGWHTPVNQHQDISDLANILALPVIIVVAIRLGCINHAKLTHQAVRHSGLPCAGWIAACTDAGMLNLEDNIDAIQAALTAPLLGVLPYRACADFDFFADQLDGSGLWH
ncbi:MAG: dethiobiotin synthase [Methylovulum sp.]|nr:dethiobiotin synthase [Methylovulum sp.]